jgi:hypothetical protein
MVYEDDTPAEKSLATTTMTTGVSGDQTEGSHSLQEGNEDDEDEDEDEDDEESGSDEDDVQFVTAKPTTFNQV